MHFRLQKSPRFDKLHVNIIKSVCDKIKAPPLTHVSRNSIENGSFLRKMKITLVAAIFKAGTKDLVTNYRPISVLFSFSKILKKRE